MDNLVCTRCGITYYSAAMTAMVARGELCDCGAALRVRWGEEMQAVGVSTGDPANGEPPCGTDGGRFSR